MTCSLPLLLLFSPCFLSSWSQLPSPISIGKQSRGCGKLAPMPLLLLSRAPSPACSPDLSRTPPQDNLTAPEHLLVHVPEAPQNVPSAGMSTAKLTTALLQPAPLSSSFQKMAPLLIQARNLNILSLTPSSHSLPTSNQPCILQYAQFHPLLSIPPASVSLSQPPSPSLGPHSLRHRLSPLSPPDPPSSHCSVRQEPPLHEQHWL